MFDIRHEAGAEAPRSLLSLARDARTAAERPRAPAVGPSVRAPMQRREPPRRSPLLAAMADLRRQQPIAASAARTPPEDAPDAPRGAPESFRSWLRAWKDVFRPAGAKATPPLGSDSLALDPERSFEVVQPPARRLPAPLTQAVAPARAAQSAPGAESAAPGEGGDERYWRPIIDPFAVIGTIFRAKWLILGLGLVGAALGVATALSTPKKYQSATELLIDPRNLKLTDRDLTEGGLPNDATLAIVENQTRVLTSGTVLNRVVDRLDLAADPEFNGTRTGFGPGAVVASLRSMLSSGNAGGDAAARRRSLAVEHLAKSLEVERGGKTFVIRIAATTEEAQKSALIANTMTDVFLQTYGELQSDTAGRAADELNGRLEELRKGVEAAERKVEAFKQANGIVDAQGKLITDEEILTLNSQLSTARARALELDGRAMSARSLDVDDALGGALPEGVGSNVVTELRSQYAALKSQADLLSVRLGPRHPQRLAVEAQLAGARDQLRTELRRIVSSIQIEQKRAAQLEVQLSARLNAMKLRQGALSGELVTLRELEREAATKRSVYEAYLLRARETGEQRGINTANMSVISTAYPPLESVGPSRAVISLGGLMLGLVAGIGLAGAYGAVHSLRAATLLRGGPLEPALAPAPPQPVPEPSAEGEPDLEELSASLRDLHERVRLMTQARHAAGA